MKSGIMSSIRLTLAIASVLAVAAGCGEQGVPAQNSQTAGQQKEVATTPAPEAVVTTPAPSGTPDVTGQAQAGRTQTPRTEGTTEPVTRTPAPVTPRTQTRTVVPAGTVIVGSLQATLSSDKAQVGDRVTVRTTEAVRSVGHTVVASGSTVRGTVTHVRAAGRLKGAAELTLRFTELVTPEGKTYSITSQPFHASRKGEGKETAAEIGGGAAAGGVLGGILGGKGGALKGAAVGAVLGTGVAATTKGDQIVMPEGHTMKVVLTSPIEVAPEVVP